MSPQMESEITMSENDQNAPLPNGLSKTNLKLDILDVDFAIGNLNSSSKNYFQDFFDQIPIPINPDLTIQANGYDPFDPFSHGPSSGFDFYEFIPCAKKAMQNFQASGGFMIHDPYNPFMEIETTLNYHDPNPLSFSIPDETSCVNNINHLKQNSRKRSKHKTHSNDIKNESTKKPDNRRQRTPKSAKGQWTIEEDRHLINLVEKYGVRKWSNIAEMLKGRIGKQCRERWHNHLRPDIKKDEWSEEEDRILISVHAKVGNKWSEIAKSLPGRSENSIKNHWNATKRRQFSRRKCRTKWPKPSSILQNYIKSLICETNNEISKTTRPNDDHAVPGFDFDEIPEFDFEDDHHGLFEGCNMDSYVDDNNTIGPSCEIDYEMPFDMPRYIGAI